MISQDSLNFTKVSSFHLFQLTISVNFSFSSIVASCLCRKPVLLNQNYLVWSLIAHWSHSDTCTFCPPGTLNHFCQCLYCLRVFVSVSAVCVKHLELYTGGNITLQQHQLWISWEDSAHMYTTHTSFQDFTGWRLLLWVKAVCLPCPSSSLKVLTCDSLQCSYCTILITGLSLFMLYLSSFFLNFSHIHRFPCSYKELSF